MAAFAFVIGALAQHGSWDQGAVRSAVDGAHDATPVNVAVHKPHAILELSAVSNPGRTLTNITVYSRGRDIGHIKSVAVDSGGVPKRVEIAFNDGSGTVWLDAAAIDYDAMHRLAVTGLDPGEIKAMETTRFH